MNITRNTLFSMLLIFSLAFNLAFAVISGYYFISRPRPEDQEETEEHRNRHGRPPSPRRMEWLNLTEEQRELRQAERQRLMSELSVERERAREIREEFLTLLEDPDSTPLDIARVAEEFHRVQLAMRRLIFQDLLELREMLDEEQRRRLGRTLMRRYISPDPTGSPRRRRPENG